MAASEFLMASWTTCVSYRVGVLLQVQVEERRGLDRRIKDLEIRLSGALSSKALSDEEHALRVKVPSCQSCL